MIVPRRISLFGLVLTLLTAVCAGAAESKNTPHLVTAAASRNLGPEDPSKAMEVSVWLKLHNRRQLDALAKELYDPQSSHFQNWLTREEFELRYAPTAAEAKQVSGYLAAHGLQVTGVGPNHLFVRAQGTVEAVSKALRVALNRYQVKDKIYRLNAGDPYLEGPVAELIATVAGLDDIGMRHDVVSARPKAASTGTFDFGASPAASPIFSSNCFPGTTTETIGTPGLYPYEVVKGNKYYSTVAGSGCGYTPSNIQTAYNLKALYKEGFDGTGQTIVIIDWCGSATIRQDANAFSARFGLPPLTAANFQIVNYPRPSLCAGEDPEINMDVEWAHAIAPGAHIALVVPPTSSMQDVDEAEYYAIVAGLGNVISGSYGIGETFYSDAELENMNLINEIASVFGISANFPVGDFPNEDLLPWAPATTPYATAIGGITLALNANSSLKWQTGWGTYQVPLAVAGQISFEPADNFSFLNGTNGGFSTFFAQPAYQAAIPNATRQVPDISWLADPLTGAIVEITIPGVSPAVLQVFGGTGLACPMFSALWAIANQEAGYPLGQAARYLYSMPKTTITDVLQVNSKTNPVATIFVGPGNSFQPDLSVTDPNAYSAIWDYEGSGGATTALLTFGVDAFISVTPGWDYATGLGAPSGKAFADYFNPAK